MQERLPSFFEIETVLASIAVTEDSLDWFLSTWTSTETEEADRNLIQFVTMYGIDFTEGRTFADAFWKESQAQATTLRNWLQRPDMLKRITLAAHLLPHDGSEHLFQPAVEGLFKEAQS